MKKYKKKRKLSHRYLLGATYRYLERYATTEANLKLILMRKVENILQEEENRDEIREESKGWVMEIIALCVKQGLVDDKLYAEARVRSFIQSGNSTSNIKNKLRAKGVPQDIIAQVIANVKQETPNINIISGIKYAKRRRFGPFRIKEAQEKTAQKELAAMARAGFSYEQSKIVLTSSKEELEDILYES